MENQPLIISVTPYYLEHWEDLVGWLVVLV